MKDANHSADVPYNISARPDKKLAAMVLEPEAMSAVSFSDLPLPDELRAEDLDITAAATRLLARRVTYELEHGRRIVLSSNPFVRELNWPVTVFEPGASK